MVHSGKINTNGLALPAISDTIMLVMKYHSFLKPLNIGKSKVQNIIIP